MNQEREIVRLGIGHYWQDLHAGQVFRTSRRTITEADLISFISSTGMLESIFVDAEYSDGAIQGRVVPGALTYCLIEGIILQSMVQGTGLALLEVHKKMHMPVFVGDTIFGEIEVTMVRPTSTNGRAVVSSNVSIFNTRGDKVLSYDVTRLLKGRPAK